MMGIVLSAFFGLISYILSFGIFVPQQLQAFNILAAASAMAGFPIGRIVAEKLERTGVKVLLIIANLLLCVASTIAYVILSQRGSADVSDIVVLAVLISIMFFSFWFLLPVAGVLIKEPSSKATVRG